MIINNNNKKRRIIVIIALFTSVSQVVNMYSGHNDLKQITRNNNETLRIILYITLTPGSFRFKKIGFVKFFEDFQRIAILQVGR